MATETKLSDAARMMRLFAGYEGAYGTHGSTSRSELKGGKMEIKKTARTIREPVTEELWQAHLDGSQPLGIIPIREDATCLWGCIDVDKYDLTLSEEAKRVRELGTPLVVCRSKSGGAHAFVFLSSPVPAEEFRHRLRELAASLGWGDCEVFPKQNQILSNKGDLGNWLNMPYLGGDSTERYAVKESVGGYSIKQFLDMAEKSRVNIEKIVPVSEKKKKEHDPVKDEGLSDGPPCLQHLASVGFPEGNRNNGLFALGVLCKKKFGTKWKEMLEKYNQLFMNPPLPAEEVMDLIKNLEKKDYNYRCKDQPIVSYCNSALCRTRKFGVGGSDLYPVISGLSKLETEPPIWFLDIDDTRLELQTDQLLNYRLFQRVAADVLTIAFMPMKVDTWMAMVGEAMANANIIEAPPEASTFGYFMELVEDFLTNRYVAETKEELLLGKPWYDHQENVFYFKLSSLMEYLDQRQFKEWSRNVVSQKIIEQGGKRILTVGGGDAKKNVRVLYIKNVFDIAGPVNLPESEEDPI